ncbi:DUF4123 domain-containing protein [Vreelandella populi]|uniref:DUF4123 domain-containing protein n=1 Tax=Vreelandella populi TaxID=2498858 RepID=UPI000F8CD5A6|nr:DUF4123 domain-containing protein [Halomonas populi]RUR52861.1 DUF4123 domain-containing protein [Halomonas populi]
MSGWLSGIEERSEPLEHLPIDNQSWWVVLDQRRASKACAAWLNQEGRKEFITLFAGTPLASLIAASPWLVEVVPGSPAALEAEAFCHQRLGWMATGKPGATLESIAEHLRSLFVLPDPHGGQTLVNIQQPITWQTLLASTDATMFQHLMAPFSALFTPTPQSAWRQWQVSFSEVQISFPVYLNRTMEEALKKSQHAWWLSGAAKVPMEALSESWLMRLQILNEAGITRPDHLQRLLPLIQRPGAFTEQERVTLSMNAPARKKIKELESLV